MKGFTLHPGSVPYERERIGNFMCFVVHASCYGCQAIQFELCRETVRELAFFATTRYRSRFETWGTFSKNNWVIYPVFFYKIAGESSWL